MNEETKNLEMPLDTPRETPKEPESVTTENSAGEEFVNDSNVPETQSQEQWAESVDGLDVGQLEPILTALAQELRQNPEGVKLVSQLQSILNALAQERENLGTQIESLAKQLHEANEQIDNWKKHAIRLKADYENFQKRTEREKTEVEKQIKRKTLTEILSVVDNFERARTQIKPANDGEMAIHKSYQGVYKNLVDSLKRLGVSAMRPEGQPFDPNYHEAMLRQPTDEHPEGTVIEQLVRGYTIDDQVLRHALVSVAAPKESEDDSPSESQA